MKILLTLCLLTFLCLLSPCSAGPVSQQLMSLGSCCSQHSNVTVPVGKVKDLQMSPSHCKLRSVIVSTQKGKRFCLDPSGSWTQKLQREFGRERRLH
ncbi:C-C motif chemokine 3 [Fundulus heteroclitus]|uniref:C-C motif chemokine 3 n=1 Tax=Fundulus heteroclitus TaxID=8078 RepID=UPI00165CB51E|nr:C-C motif chemokine 3 [Fundulus heteroclitus]